MLLISVRCSTLSVPLVDPYNSNGPCTKARTLHVCLHYIGSKKKQYVHYKQLYFMNIYPQNILHKHFHNRYAFCVDDCGASALRPLLANIPAYCVIDIFCATSLQTNFHLQTTYPMQKFIVYHISQIPFFHLYNAVDGLLLCIHLHILCRSYNVRSHAGQGLWQTLELLGTTLLCVYDLEIKICTHAE